MTDRPAGTSRDLWLSGIAAGALAMALALAGVTLAVAAVAGFAVGAVLYSALLFGAARKP